MGSRRECRKANKTAGMRGRMEREWHGWMQHASRMKERERAKLCMSNYICIWIQTVAASKRFDQNVTSNQFLVFIHFPNTRQTKHLTCASERFPFPFNEKFVDNRLTHTAQTISHYSSATRRAIQMPRLSPIDTPATDKYVRCKPNG